MAEDAAGEGAGEEEATEPEGGARIARDALARAREDAAARRREHEGTAAARRRAATRTANATPRPHTGDGDPMTMAAAISELLADRGWGADAIVASVTANWADTVGPELAAHCRPLGLSSGVLTVEAESTAWATQIRLLQRQLLERVAAVAGTDVVRTLVVQGPTGPSWQHGRLRVRGRGPRDTYG